MLSTWLYASHEHTYMLAFFLSFVIICLPMNTTKQKGRSFEAVLIGKQIRYLRRIKDISQETLAKQVGVTVGWIGRIERGIHLPNIKLLVKIARALQVKVKDLIPNELV